MFGNWALGPRNQAGFSNIKRHSGPLSFPPYHVPTGTSFAYPETERSFTSFFAKIKRATDLTPEHLASLGVVVKDNTPWESLFPAEPPKDEKQAAEDAERERELGLDNETAFQVLARERRDVKLGHMYRFFQAVELVEPYYDLSPTADPANNDDDFSLPERFREDMVQHFIDPLCWQWGLRTYPPRGPPKVALKNILYNVHLTTHLVSTPSTPALARQGVVFGPVAAVQVRHEHTFRALRDPNALFLRRRRAQLAANASAAPPPPGSKKRSRTNSRPSSSKKKEDAKDKPKGEIIDEDDEADLKMRSGVLSFVQIDGEEKEVDVIGLGREVAAALHLAQARRVEAGKKVCGVTTAECTRADGDVDEVYLLTARHHHLAITKVTIWRRYLGVLKEGGRGWTGRWRGWRGARRGGISWRCRGRGIGACWCRRRGWWRGERSRDC